MTTVPLPSTLRRRPPKVRVRAGHLRKDSRAGRSSAEGCANPRAPTPETEGTPRQGFGRECFHILGRISASRVSPLPTTSRSAHLNLRAPSGHRNTAYRLVTRAVDEGVLPRGSDNSGVPRGQVS